MSIGSLLLCSNKFDKRAQKNVWYTIYCIYFYIIPSIYEFRNFFNFKNKIPNMYIEGSLTIRTLNLFHLQFIFGFLFVIDLSLDSTGLVIWLLLCGISKE